jgi:hypothetical protein
MGIKSFTLWILILSLVFVSCNKGTPAGFWKGYNSRFLIKNISDQGPYGGHRAIYWKADGKNTFSSIDIIHFANKNGWTFVDSAEFNQDQTDKWVNADQQIFPLSHTGFSYTADNNSTYKNFPRWVGGKIKIFRFKTGWLTISPGTDHSIEENGFVLLNRDKNKMAVYHLWGE